MSKTFRRKNYSRDLSWVLRDWDFSDDNLNVGRRIKIDPHSKEGKKRLARYHSDAARFMGNAPSWYCRFFQKEARIEARRQLHRYLRHPEDLANNRGFMVMIDPKHHHSATWAWW